MVSDYLVAAGGDIGSLLCHRQLFGEQQCFIEDSNLYKAMES
ncbi:MAG: hypothetical protein ACKON9_30510 [Planctomycetaceae bacterium]